MSEGSDNELPVELGRNAFDHVRRSGTEQDTRAIAWAAMADDLLRPFIPGILASGQRVRMLRRGE